VEYFLKRILLKKCTDTALGKINGISKYFYFQLEERIEICYLLFPEGFSDLFLYLGIMNFTEKKNNKLLSQKPCAKDDWLEIKKKTVCLVRTK
jgi:hypothetical protein